MQRKLVNHFQDEHLGEATIHLLTNELKIPSFICDVW